MPLKYIVCAGCQKGTGCGKNCDCRQEGVICTRCNMTAASKDAESN